MSISDEFLSGATDGHWWEDERLKDIETELSSINDPQIKSFVQWLLTRSEYFWIAPISLEEGTYPPDTLIEGGAFRHTMRTVDLFLLIEPLLELSSGEKDCMLAALLIRNVNRAAIIDEEWVVDTLHMYHIDRFIETMLTLSQTLGEDVGSFIGISTQDLQMITRLIRVSDGMDTLMPETLPVTTMEKMICILDTLASNVHLFAENSDG